MSAANRKNYETGKLPYLGLSRYKTDDLIKSNLNPYSVQPNTEKMLVLRELEREVKELNKFEKDTLKVYEKPIATRIDRTGKLKELAEVAANSKKERKDN